jgi:hypothetical protein
MNYGVTSPGTPLVKTIVRLVSVNRWTAHRTGSLAAQRYLENVSVIPETNAELQHPR